MGVENLLPYPTRLAIFVSGVLAASLYTFYVIRPLKSHRARLVASLPVLLANILLHCLFSAGNYEVIESVLAWGVCIWIANFRLTIFCFGNGRLAHPAICRTFPAFLIALYFPLKVHVSQRKNSRDFEKENGANLSNVSSMRSGGERSMAGQATSRSIIELLLATVVKVTLAYLVSRIYGNAASSSPYLSLFLQALIIFLALSGVYDILAVAVAVLASDLVIEPHFDAPYLSSSLQDFWARRWNLTISHVLKETVYEPIVSIFPPSEVDSSRKEALKNDQTLLTPSHPGTLDRSSDNSSIQGRIDTKKGSELECQERSSTAASRGPNGRVATKDAEALSIRRKPSSAARLAGLLASFFVSGLMHEHLYFVLVGDITGEMLTFFCLHGALTAAEVLMWRKVRKVAPKLQVPRLVAVPAIFALMMTTGNMWFLGPYERSGILNNLCVEILLIFGLKQASGSGDSRS